MEISSLIKFGFVKIKKKKKISGENLLNLKNPARLIFSQEYKIVKKFTKARDQLSSASYISFRADSI